LIKGITINDSEAEKYLVYTLCAKDFGWTPEVVDKIDAVVLDYILTSNAEITKEQNRVNK
jgi:hypothetical protein